MRARRDAALRLLKTMLVATIVIPVALFSYAAWINYRDAFAHADEQLTASLNILSEHASKVFQSVDLTFTSVDAIVGDLTDEQIKTNEEALHLQLSKLEKALATVEAILVADKNGHTLVSSAIFPVPNNFGVVDRDYFLAQREQDAGNYVGAILQPRLRKVAFFGVSRRRPLRDGQFNGIIMVSVVPMVFSEFYAQLAGDTTASFSLARKDGAILARHPMPPGESRISCPIAGLCLTSSIIPKVASLRPTIPSTVLNGALLTASSDMQICTYPMDCRLTQSCRAGCGQWPAI